MFRQQWILRVDIFHQYFHDCHISQSIAFSLNFVTRDALEPKPVAIEARPSPQRRQLSIILRGPPRCKPEFPPATEVGLPVPLLKLSRVPPPPTNLILLPFWSLDCAVLAVAKPRWDVLGFRIEVQRKYKFLIAVCYCPVQYFWITCKRDSAVRNLTRSSAVIYFFSTKAIWDGPPSDLRLP